MRPRRLGAAEHGWVVWAAATTTGGTLSFPSRRKLGHGLSVVGNGVVPWAARRADGWTLTASGVPPVEAMPPWLVTVLGGRWKAARSA